jgi:hypothetical protein
MCIKDCEELCTLLQDNVCSDTSGSERSNDSYTNVNFSSRYRKSTSSDEDHDRGLSQYMKLGDHFGQ